MKNVFDFVWFIIVVCLMIFASVLFGMVAYILIESKYIILIPAGILIYLFGPTILDIVIAYEMVKEINKEFDK
ncbi:hypothetical protein [Megamonas hypermegale]|uniref:hypothetical protein n=1 Tax=Megamonas hypermegale TaxID=158847 RepID=UPI0026E93A1E|nr:hypothetical protein [Megamonas hypermegale]